MPKIIHEYSLPEDDYDEKMARMGATYFAVIHGIVAAARSRVKYGPSLDDKFYDEIWQILRDHNIDPWE